MLTKKQLEDAIMCHTECEWEEEYNCGLYDLGESSTDCIQLLAKTALVYREMLERLEWTGQTRHGIGLAPSCPICEMAKSEGHKPGCELAAILKEAGE